MIQLFTLPNRIRVILEPIPYLRSVSLGVWIRAGSAFETPKTNGISHVIEHMLFKGTKKRTAKDIADMTSALGGNLNAFTGKECTSYYIRTLDNHLFEAVDLLSDMLLNSLLEAHDLEKEKSVILDEIDMYEDSPEDMVHEMLQKEVWPGHPLGFLISGEKEVVENFSAEQVRAFKDAWYTGENIVISAAGNFSPEQLKEKLTEAFSEFPESGGRKGEPAPRFMPCHYKKSRDIEQVHLNIAYPAITSLSEERYAFSVVNSVLGGSVNSRLFQKIREDQGLAYTIYSYGSSFEQSGLFQIYAAMNPAQLAQVQEGIRETVEELVRDKITADELYKAKEEIKTELIIQSESTQNRMEHNAKSIIQFNRIIPVDETLKAIHEVTLEDTARILEQYLGTDKKASAVIGNLS